MAKLQTLPAEILLQILRHLDQPFVDGGPVSAEEAIAYQTTLVACSRMSRKLANCSSTILGRHVILPDALSLLHFWRSVKAGSVDASKVISISLPNLVTVDVASASSMFSTLLFSAIDEFIADPDHEMIFQSLAEDLHGLSVVDMLHSWKSFGLCPNPLGFPLDMVLFMTLTLLPNLEHLMLQVEATSCEYMVFEFLLSAHDKSYPDDESRLLGHLLPKLTSLWLRSDKTGPTRMCDPLLVHDLAYVMPTAHLILERVGLANISYGTSDVKCVCLRQAVEGMSIEDMGNIFPKLEQLEIWLDLYKYERRYSHGSGMSTFVGGHVLHSDSCARTLARLQKTLRRLDLQHFGCDGLYSRLAPSGQLCLRSMPVLTHLTIETCTLGLHDFDARAIRRILETHGNDDTTPTLSATYGAQALCRNLPRFIHRLCLIERYFAPPLFIEETYQIPKIAATLAQRAGALLAEFARYCSAITPFLRRLEFVSMNPCYPTWVEEVEALYAAVNVEFVFVQMPMAFIEEPYRGPTPQSLV